MRREALAKVLENEPALSDGEGFGERRGRDGDDGGFAERVDFFELRAGEFVGLALVDFDFVGEVGQAFLEEPDYALGTGLFEPGGRVGEFGFNGVMGGVCELEGVWYFGVGGGMVGTGFYCRKSEGENQFRRCSICGTAIVHACIHVRPKAR